MSDNGEHDEDSTLFRDAMRSVTPLKSRNKKARNPVRKPLRRKSGPPADPQHTIFSTEAVPDCPDQLSYQAPGIQHSVMKKLRQGKIAVDNRLDLHGLTVEQARVALIDFLDDCTERDTRCALIVHGKGYRSPDNKPVIKPMVNRWLRESPQVLAFGSAQPKDGGKGAVYVLFKRNT